MIDKCRFGLIAKSRDPRKNYFVFLGEIKEENEDRLYDLHKELRFLCNFNATISLDLINVVPDNIEEILAFQNKYNIDKKISFAGIVDEKFIRLSSPQLYDISCMIPLFSDADKRSIKPNGKSYPGIFFILPACEDPFIRGKIIDNCFDAANGREISFYLLGEKYMLNKIKTCELSRRYLLSCGLEDKNIVCSDQGNNKEGWLVEAIDMIKFITGDGNEEIVIAVNRESVNLFMNYIRSEKSFNRITKKVRIICN
jgi:hypothetical protein